MLSSTGRWKAIWFFFDIQFLNPQKGYNPHQGTPVSKETAVDMKTT